MNRCGSHPPCAFNQRESRREQNKEPEYNGREGTYCLPRSLVLFVGVCDHDTYLKPLPPKLL